MTDDDRIQAFLINNENTPRKPAAPLPRNRRVATEPGAPSNHGGELKELRDEMVRVRYILEDLRDDKRSAQNSNRPILSQEQFEELKAMISLTREPTDEDTLEDILIRIADMREDILRLVTDLRSNALRITKDNIIYSLEGYGIDIMNILIENGVSLSPSISDEFDPSQHMISAVIETDKPEQQGIIAESLGDTYVKDGRTILKSRVKVYRYVKKEVRKKTQNNKSESKEEDAT